MRLPLLAERKFTEVKLTKKDMIEWGKRMKKDEMKKFTKGDKE